MTNEKVDDSFEIITLKEKYLKDQLAIAEDSLMKSEFNVLVNQDIIKRVTEEIAIEHEKTQKTE